MWPIGTLLLAMREGQSDWWIIDERLLGPAFYIEQGLTPTALVGGAIALLVLASVGNACRLRPADAVAGNADAQCLDGDTRSCRCLWPFSRMIVEDFLMPPLTALGGEWFAQICEEVPELLFATLILEAILAAAPVAASEKKGLTPTILSPRAPRDALPDRLVIHAAAGGIFHFRRDQLSA